MSWFISHSDDIGKLVLRVSVAAFILVYGIQKITNPATMEYVEGLLIAIGVPAVVAYGVYLGEVVAPILIMLGWRTKIAAAVMSVTMVVVILLGHTEEIFPLSNFRWWGIELQVLFLLNSIAVMCVGAGKFAISHKSIWD